MTTSMVADTKKPSAKSQTAMIAMHPARVKIIGGTKWPAENMVGRSHGMLAVESHSHHSGTMNYWIVKCECGGTRSMSSASIRKWKVDSCGCQVYKKSHQPGYKNWKSMRERCLNKSHKSWSDYGGRGITICARWDNFKAFAEDMGAPPKGMTLDRYPDNEGNYEPSNCRWATAKEQANNRRSNRVITFAGKTQTLAHWSEEVGVKEDVLRWRLEAGAPLERVFSRDCLPLGSRKFQPVDPMARGGSMTQLARLRHHYDTPGIGLTQRDAMTIHGIGRLAQRIAELEREGFQFDHRTIKVESRHGTARVTDYVLMSLPRPIEASVVMLAEAP